MDFFEKIGEVGGKTVGALNDGLTNFTTSVGTTFSNIGDNIKKVVVQKPPELIVQEQFDYYNEQNLPKFLELFSENVIVSNFNGSGPAIEGKENFTTTYERLFQDYPMNRAELLHRIVIRNRVIDHEKVFRSGGTSATFECVAVYTIENEKIVRIDFIK